MLSKVAERVYWTARYLERVENTARLVNIYDKLLFDLPRSVKISWYTLIVINDLEYEFGTRYAVRDERNVVKFLLGDKSSPCSVVSSLHAIRENVRTTRDVVLGETWELVNELCLCVNGNIQQGINRSQRHNFLEEIIKGCQQIWGLLYGNMPHDSAWAFLRLGRNIERADMTTRNLAAGTAIIREMKNDDNAVNSSQIVWGTILRSLNADQSYRRCMRTSISAVPVVNYLLENEEFPRAIAHCLNVMLDSSGKLPRTGAVLIQLLDIQKLFKEIDYGALDESFGSYLNEFQIRLAALHHVIGETWFPRVE